MRETSEENEIQIDKKIELMIKVIIRTDTYLNYANTKSTILLSLASAIIAAIAVNFDKITSFVVISSDKCFLSFLLGLTLCFLIVSVFFSLKGITPFIKASESINTFSFVDIVKGYDSMADYKKEFCTVSDSSFLNQLISLNHNLSKALLSKYENQIIAIKCIEVATCIICFSIYIIFLSNL